jgi:hypothetical protein
MPAHSLESPIELGKLDASKKLALRCRVRGESMRGQPGFFDVDERLQRLTGLGDQLLAFARVIDSEAFQPELTKALAGDRRSIP